MAKRKKKSVAAHIRLSARQSNQMSKGIDHLTDHQLGADAPNASAQTSSCSLPPDGICNFTQGCCWQPSTPSNRSLKASPCLFAPGMLLFTPHPPDPEGRGEMPCLQPFRENGPQQVLGKHAAHQAHLSCTAAADAQPLLCGKAGKLRDEVRTGGALQCWTSQGK